MTSSEKLLSRLEDIGRAIESSGHAIALIGLGSAGLEIQRMDEFSDLDFFVITEPGHKQRYVLELDWLDSIAPIAFKFRNTVDGWKVMFADGIFAEFAVFEQAELSRIPFAPGRIIWKRPEVSALIAQPSIQAPNAEASSVEWQLGEVLSNLYIGMCRYMRGEKLSAARFVQQFAVDRMLALHETASGVQDRDRDVFSLERRWEHRYPGADQWLMHFMQGYQRTPESARAILDYLCAHYAVNAVMEREIRKLCDRAGSGAGSAE